MNGLGFLSMAGSLVQGLGGMAAGNANAARAEAQAEEERRASIAEARRIREDRRSQIGEQLAGQVSNGLEGGSGTALDALRQSQINAALDAMEVRRQGEGRARSLETRAKDSRTQGRFALLSGVLGAGSQYIKQRSDWAQERVIGGVGFDG